MKPFLFLITVLVSNYILAQNVGIGTNAPYAPLTFNNNIGQKISLYGTAINNYGLGVVGGTLQIHSDAQGSDIAFGHGNSGAFTQIMRMKGNGNVGIGTNPTYLLDLNGRMRIRSSGDINGTAGLWLNNLSNVEKVFMGMEDDTHVGFYSVGSGWRFSVNTESGALKVNGNEGAPGQVITSNGTAAPTWTSPTNSLYNNTQEFFQTSSINITGFNDVPGLTQTITVPACKVMLIVKGTLSLNSCFNCGFDPCRFDIWVDGTNIERYEETAGNGQTIHVTNGAKIHSLTAGTHTIAVKVDGPYGRYWDVSGFKLVIFAIPQ